MLSKFCGQFAFVLRRILVKGKEKHRKTASADELPLAPAY